MSYVEICDKFEEVLNYLATTSDETTSLAKFFMSYKRVLEAFSNQLQKLSESFKVSSLPEGNINTLSLCLYSMKDHLQTLADQQILLIKSIQLDIIEPLELFTEHFTTTNSDLKIKGFYNYRELKTSQSRMNKHKQDYYKTSAELDKATRLSMTEESKDKQENAQRLGIHLMTLQEKHLDNYIQGIVDVNKHWDEYDNVMPSIMESLQQNEESRIHFIKNSLEKYIRYYQKYQNSVYQNLEKLGEMISNVNSAIDIRVFVDSLKSKKLVTREQFVNYEDWKQSLNEEDYEVVENEFQVLHSAIESFLDNSTIEKTSGIESENFSKLSEIISSSEGRKLFIESLQYKTNQPFVIYENLTQIAALIKDLLSSMIRDNESDPFVFSSIVGLSDAFYTLDDGKKKFLAYFISPHAVWEDPKRWLQAINFTISNKTASDKENSQKSKKKSKFMSFLAEIVKNTGPEKPEKALAYLILSRFSFHMVKLNVHNNVACSIILSSGKEYEINDEKVMLLISEIQARSDLFLKFPQKNRIKSRSFEEIIKISSKFLEYKDICELSLVSKQLHTVLLRKKYKKVILSNILTNYPDFRKKLWMNLLNVENIQLDYWKIVSSLDSPENSLEELANIIEVDVARSFQRNSEINSGNLKNILKVHALFNKNIGYCQGMNFIAGSLFLITQDEELACKSLLAMIEAFSMSSLFTNNLKKLKKLFYILDRLIVIKLPKLNESFKDAWVFSDHFSSGWFLTLFSSTLQSRFDVLVRIWDLFFLYGWKAIFSICIVILTRYAEDLVDKSFEDILFILSGLANSAIFDETFFNEVAVTGISNQLIDELEKEYEKIVIRSSFNC